MNLFIYSLDLELGVSKWRQKNLRLKKKKGAISMVFKESLQNGFIFYVLSHMKKNQSLGCQKGESIFLTP